MVNKKIGLAFQQDSKATNNPDLDFLFEQLVGNKAHNVSKAGHVSQHDQRPFPTAGFTFHDSQRTHALHRQCIKNKK
jgi:hypothetical protein